MTREYARLSMKAGWLAGMADAYLGGTRFTLEGRRHNRQLTDEYLEQLRQQMIDAGVPAELLNLDQPEIKSALADEGFIDAGLAIQAKAASARNQ